jgi:hypothetical protein
MARQAVLDKPNRPELRILPAETVLACAEGGPKIMREQQARLLEDSNLFPRGDRRACAKRGATDLRRASAEARSNRSHRSTKACPVDHGRSSAGTHAASYAVIM